MLDDVKVAWGDIWVDGFQEGSSALVLPEVTRDPGHHGMRERNLLSGDAFGDSRGNHIEFAFIGFRWGRI